MKLKIEMPKAVTPNLKWVEVPSSAPNSPDYILPDCSKLVANWKNHPNYHEITADVTKKIEHSGSRVKDVNITTEFKDNFAKARNILGFQTVCPETLYKTPSGVFLPANVLNMGSRTVVMHQSPFNLQNYFEMIEKLNISIMTSLARPGKDVVDYYRADSPLSQHSLDIGQEVTCSHFKVVCLNEKHIENSIVLKQYGIIYNNGSVKSKFFIDCRNWQDMGNMNPEGLVTLVNLIESISSKMNYSNPASVNLAFNCAYGFNRSTALCVMTLISSAIKTALSAKYNQKPSELNLDNYPKDIMEMEVDIKSFLNYMSANVMGCAGAIHYNDIAAYVEKVQSNAREILAKSINYGIGL